MKRNSDDESGPTSSTSKRKMSDVKTVDNSRSVIEKIANLYAERLMSDVCLVVGNHEYPSHRLILCASSDVFQVMLMNQSWSESFEKRIVLVETQACETVFEDFLRYLYTGKVLLDFATVVPLASLADKYNVKDLLKLSLDFMMRNISTACKKNQLFSWFQFALGGGHSVLADQCRNFIKWNFEVASKTLDFSTIEADLLATFLTCNDLVITDELKLFDCLFRWIQARKRMLMSRGEDNIDLHVEKYIRFLFPLIRYPMMNHDQLTELLAFETLIKAQTEILVEYIRFAIGFHKDTLDLSQTPSDDRLMFTPRLYTIEKFCESLCINHIGNLRPYHSRSLVFSCQKHMAHHSSEEQSEWFVKAYPKGVWFEKCLTVYHPPGLELPEKVIKTVRVSISTKEDTEQRVRIGILVVGEQDGFEHVRQVQTRSYIFDRQDKIVNFDDVINFDELNDCKHVSNFLTGNGKDTFKVIIVITPLTKFSRL